MRGSSELDNLLRCKYTSVPYLSYKRNKELVIKTNTHFSLIIKQTFFTYPSIDINFKSPPKYLAYYKYII